MVQALLLGALTGAAFGAVLYKVGATRYSRVMGMLTLRDTKVMKFAFTAIGVASLLYGLAAALGLSEPLGLAPRVMPFQGWAHVLGGVLFGAGLGVSGLCPGTCVAKTGGRGGEKRFAGTAAILGLVAGVLVYGAVKDRLLASGVVDAHQRPLTLYGELGLPYAAAALAWGALFLVLAALVDRLTPEVVFEPDAPRRGLLQVVRGEWSWAASGTVGGPAGGPGHRPGRLPRVLGRAPGGRRLGRPPRGSPPRAPAAGERGHRLARGAPPRGAAGRLAGPPRLAPVARRRGGRGRGAGDQGARPGRPGAQLRARPAS